jgi:hypothetical protein
MQLKAEIKRGGSSGGDLSDELVKDCKNPIISDMAEYDELQRQLLNTSFRNAIVSNYHYILLKYKIHMVFLGRPNRTQYLDLKRSLLHL